MTKWQKQESLGTEAEAACHPRVTRSGDGWRLYALLRWPAYAVVTASGVA